MLSEHFNKLATTVGRVEFAVAVVAFSISAFMSFLGVVFRYVLEIPSWWIFPVQHYSYLFLIFFGAAIAARQRIHVRVEILDSMLSKTHSRENDILRAILHGIALTSACFFTYLSFDFMIRMWASNQHDVILTWFNLGVVKTLPFVMGVLLCAYIGRDLAVSISRLRNSSLAGGPGL
ncbi:MAG: TRAP transporter small permease subunit [Dehalococcoidia bacterium]|nr:TRAP transporter small permease subunit [Dehalococcoidia bacterium]